MKEQTTPAVPLASEELKQRALAAINQYFSYYQHSSPDTVEAVGNFLSSYEDLDDLYDVSLFIEHLMAYFLNPVHSTAFSEKYPRSEYTLSDMLPRLLSLFQELNSDVSRAYLRRDWLTNYAGVATQKEVAKVLGLYTDENKKWEAVHRAA